MQQIIFRPCHDLVSTMVRHTFLPCSNLIFVHAAFYFSSMPRFFLPWRDLIFDYTAFCFGTMQQINFWPCYDLFFTMARLIFWHCSELFFGHTSFFSDHAATHLCLCRDFFFTMPWSISQSYRMFLTIQWIIFQSSHDFFWVRQDLFPTTPSFFEPAAFYFFISCFIFLVQIAIFFLASRDLFFDHNAFCFLFFDMPRLFLTLLRPIFHHAPSFFRLCSKT